MPQIGEIKSGHALGYKTNTLMIWTACPMCGKEKWIRLSEYKKHRRLFCVSCSKSGDSNPGWTGGKLINAKGYVHIWLPKNSPYYPMTNGRRGRVLEHRLMMAISLGRCLKDSEVVHHINGIRHDNRLANLELISSRGRHNTHHDGEIRELISEIKKLTSTVQDQSKQIKYLQWQLNNSQLSLKLNSPKG